MTASCSAFSFWVLSSSLYSYSQSILTLSVYTYTLSLYLYRDTQRLSNIRSVLEYYSTIAPPSSRYSMMGMSNLPINKEETRKQLASTLEHLSTDINTFKSQQQQSQLIHQEVIKCKLKRNWKQVENVINCNFSKRVMRNDRNPPWFDVSPLPTPSLFFSSLIYSIHNNKNNCAKIIPKESSFYKF